MELLLTDTGDGGEFTLKGGDLEGCNTFYSAIYVSLFGGSAFYNIYEDYETDNEFENALSLPITKQNLKNVEKTAMNALKWLVDENAVDDLTVSAYGDIQEKINVDITITEPNSTEHNYGIIWENQRAVLRIRN